MHGVRENPATASRVATPTEVAGYKGLLGSPADFPGDLHDQVKSVLVSISNGLARHRPPGIEAIVAYSPASWKRAISEVTLHSFSALRQWQVLDRITSLPFEGDFIETDFIVRPVSMGEWAEHVSCEGPVFRYVQGRGILVYDQSLGLNLRGHQQGGIEDHRSRRRGKVFAHGVRSSRTSSMASRASNGSQGPV